MTTTKKYVKFILLQTESLTSIILFKVSCNKDLCDEVIFRWHLANNAKFEQCAIAPCCTEKKHMTWQKVTFNTKVERCFECSKPLIPYPF